MTEISASVVSPTRLGDMLASAENMVDPDGELTDGETFKMGNVQEYFFNFSSKFSDIFCLEIPPLSEINLKVLKDYSKYGSTKIE